ncbi:hypothetical protein PIIN_01094 [Serendipita indica DSM 11827]|uniref:Uncharacterized protein n=1 Tax=Serendipita indica (strain DSM 11827) TaxID=1109443 RepID=G4T7I1_SERID|nr:hypothetical protein PIIN_01094 [Serendipita indica DSM 11827]
MCKYRRVHQNYHACGHEYDLEEQIDCFQPYCKFSSCHTQEPHDCRRKCSQYGIDIDLFARSSRQFPQTYGEPEQACAS